MQNTTSQKNKIESICTNGYQLDFGTVFESALENYKKIALYAGLMLLVFSVLFTVIVFTGLISYIGIENFEDFGNKMKQFSTLKELPLDIALQLNASIILISAIINPFMAGFLKMANCAEKGEEFHVSTMFSYYKFPYFFNIFTSVIIVGILGAGIEMLMKNVGLGFVGSVTTMLISFLTFLAIPLIVFANLNATEAIKYSILLVSKQPLVLLGLVIVAAIGSILGFFGLCIGIFFTYPFIYSMNYTIYKTIIGIEDTSEIEEISGT